MKVVHYTDVDLEPVYAEGAKGAQIRWLIAQKDGAPNFALRMLGGARWPNTLSHS